MSETALVIQFLKPYSYMNFLRIICIKTSNMESKSRIGKHL